MILAVRAAIRCGLTRGRDLRIASAPVLAWRRSEPDAASGHAPAHPPTAFLHGFRVHTLLCRGTGLPRFGIVAPATGHDAPFAQPLRAWAVRRYDLRPRVIRLDAAYWGLRLIDGIPATCGAAAGIPWNPKRQKNRTRLPPTWTAQEVGKRGSIERFFGRAFRFFGLQRPPVVGWTAVVQRGTRTDTAVSVVARAAHHAGRPDLIRSPKRARAHLWEGGE